MISIQVQAINAYPSLLVKGFDNEDEWTRTGLLDYLLVDDIESRLVDQAHVKTLLTAAKDSIVGTIHHITIRYDETALPSTIISSFHGTNS